MGDPPGLISQIYPHITGSTGQSQQKLPAFVICLNALEASSSNSVDPGQTAPVGVVWSSSTLLMLLYLN